MTPAATAGLRDRVEVFVDGFNFYFGLMESGLGHLRWLDWVALAHRLNTSEDRVVTRVNYYTARVTRDPDAAARQSTYIDALTARHPDEEVFRLIPGRLQWEPRECTHCHASFEQRVEKMTDVKLATDMVAGALLDEYDVAMLISGDADQVPAIEFVQSVGKKVVRVVFPPGRESDHLRATAHTAYPVNPNHLGQCQLPEVVHGWKGKELTRPPSWR